MMNLWRALSAMIVIVIVIVTVIVVWIAFQVKQLIK